MEPSHALQGLIEAAELVKMLEDLCSPGTVEKVSSSSMGGVRVTLRGIRKGILQSHDVLAARLIQQARNSGSALNVEKISSPSKEPEDIRNRLEEAVQKGKRGLRESIEDLR